MFKMGQSKIFSALCFSAFFALSACDSGKTASTDEATTVTVDGFTLDQGEVCAGIDLATITAVQSPSGETQQATQVCDIAGTVDNFELHLPASNSGYNIQWVLAGELRIQGDSGELRIEDNYIMKAKPAGHLHLTEGSDFEIGLFGTRSRVSRQDVRDADMGLRIEPVTAGEPWQGMTVEGANEYSRINAESVVLVNAPLRIINVNEDNGVQPKVFRQIQIIDPPAAGLTVVNSRVDLERILVSGAKSHALVLEGPYYPRVRQAYLQSTGGSGVVVNGASAEQKSAIEDQASQKPLLINLTVVGKNGLVKDSLDLPAITATHGTGFDLMNTFVAGYKQCLVTGAEDALYLRNLSLACEVPITVNGNERTDMLAADLGLFALDTNTLNQTIDGLLIPSEATQAQRFLAIPLDEQLSAFAEDDGFFADGIHQDQASAQNRFFGFAVGEVKAAEQEENTGLQVNVGFVPYLQDPFERWYAGKTGLTQFILNELPPTPLCNNMGSVSSVRLSIGDDQRRVCLLQRDIEKTTDTVELVGSITDSTADNDGSSEPVVWLVAHRMLVGANAEVPVNERKKLILMADTHVRFFKNTGLVINRGGSIEVAGTKDRPVVLASFDKDYSLAEGELIATGELDAEGRDMTLPVFQAEWDGLIINGSARNNTCPNAMAAGGDCNLVTGIAGINSHHGGYNDEDTSGSIAFLEVYEAEAGMQLNSVGSATAMKHIALAYNKAAGLALDGGAANVQQALISNNALGGLHWKNGYRGVISHSQIKFADTAIGAGIDAGGAREKLQAYVSFPSPLVYGLNNAVDSAAMPVSRPMLANVSVAYLEYTLFPFAERNVLGNFGPQLGLHLAQGSGLNLYNAVVSTTDTCMRVADSDTLSALQQRGRFKNVIFDCKESSYGALMGGEDQSKAFIDSQVVSNVREGKSNALVSSVEPALSPQPIDDRSRFVPSASLRFGTEKLNTQQRSLTDFDAEAYTKRGAELLETDYYGDVFYDNRLNTVCTNERNLPVCSNADLAQGRACDVSQYPECSVALLTAGVTCINREVKTILVNEDRIAVLPTFLPLQLSVIENTRDALKNQFRQCTPEEIAQYDPLTGRIEGLDGICRIPQGTKMTDMPKAEALGLDGIDISPFILANYEQHYYDALSAQCTPALPQCTLGGDLPCIEGEAREPLFFVYREGVKIQSCDHVTDDSKMCMTFDALGKPGAVDLPGGNSFSFTSVEAFGGQCDAGKASDCLTLFPSDQQFATYTLADGTLLSTCLEAGADTLQCIDFALDDNNLYQAVIKTIDPDEPEPTVIAQCKDVSTGETCVSVNIAGVIGFTINALNSLENCANTNQIPCFETDEAEQFNDMTVRVKTRGETMTAKQYIESNGLLAHVAPTFIVQGGFNCTAPCMVALSSGPAILRINADNQLNLCNNNNRDLCFTTGQTSDFSDLNILVVQNESRAILKQYLDDNGIVLEPPAPSPVAISICDSNIHNFPCVLDNDVLVLGLHPSSALRQCNTTVAPCFTSTVTDDYHDLNITVTTSQGDESLKAYAEKSNIDLTPEPLPVDVTIALCNDDASNYPCVENNDQLVLADDGGLLVPSCAGGTTPCFESIVSDSFTERNIFIRSTTGNEDLHSYAENNGIDLSPPPAEPAVAIASCNADNSNMPCMLQGLSLLLTPELSIGTCQFSAPACFSSSVTDGYTDVNIMIDTGDGEVSLKQYAADKGIDLSPPPPVEPAVAIASCNADNSNMPCMLQGLSLLLTPERSVGTCQFSAPACFSSSVTDGYTDLNIMIDTGDGEVSLKQYAADNGINLNPALNLSAVTTVLPVTKEKNLRTVHAHHG